MFTQIIHYSFVNALYIHRHRLNHKRPFHSYIYRTCLGEDCIVRIYRSTFVVFTCTFASHAACVRPSACVCVTNLPFDLGRFNGPFRSLFTSNTDYIASSHRWLYERPDDRGRSHCTVYYNNWHYYEHCANYVGIVYATSRMWISMLSLSKLVYSIGFIVTV